MALPFAIEDMEQVEACGGPQCTIRGLLPDDLQNAGETAPHLMEYLHLVPMKDVGVPQYFDTLTRAAGDLKDRNLIYRVSDELFVHIFQDGEDARDYYIAVEPAMLHDMHLLLQAMERRLLNYVEELSSATTEEEKRDVLLRAVDENCAVSDGGNGASAAGKKRGNGGLFGMFSKGPKDLGPLRVNAAQLAALKYILIRDKLRMGALEPVLQDIHIEDISCSGVGALFIEHKIFKGLKSNISFETHEQLDDFVLRMAERIGKPVTYRNPIVDATLPDGSRVNIVYGSDVSKTGSNFTIRKFAQTPLSLIDIINSGGIDFTMAAYLSLMVGEGLNLFVSGETASGKTTLLNALAAFVPPDAKIVSIEDTPEFQVPHPNWIREVVRGSLADNDSAVTMFSLLKAALRQRPNLIVVGEIRGEEGAVAFQAMQTGHAVMATFHASTVEKLIQRMTGNPINVPKAYIDNLNVVVIASAVRLPDGKRGRRIISVNELVGYDKSTDSFAFVEVFRWNSATDQFEFTGNMNSYLLENQIAQRRGIPAQNKRAIYQEVERRAALFNRLAEQGMNDFYELYTIFSKAQREGLL
jgi:flagellar protein FlaI